MKNDWQPKHVVLFIGAAIMILLWRPLLGLGSLLPNDLLNGTAPWSAMRSGPIHNTWLSDTIDVHTHFASWADAIRSGDVSWWDRSLAGGLPRLKAGASPLVWLYLLVPASYAPGLVAAARAVVASGLMFGFLRSLNTDRSAAAIGGVAYAFTGYLIIWASWPQSNVAAFAPALFWATERLLRDPRPRRSVPLALTISALLLSNFPLATGYLLLATGVYAAVRAVSIFGAPLSAAALSRMRKPAWWGIIGALLGVALVSVYVSEFSNYFDFADTSPRERAARDSSTGTRFALTMVIPWAFGAGHATPAFWAAGSNPIEAQGYVGASVLVLALLTLGHLTRGQRRKLGGAARHRSSAVTALWIIAILGVWVSYVGGPLTSLLQSIPLLGQNSVGRSRVVTHLAVAALAGLGAQFWLDACRQSVGINTWRALRNGAIAVGVIVVAFSPWLLDWAREARSLGYLDDSIRIAIVPMLAAGILVGGIILRVRTRSTSRWDITIAALVVAVELLVFARPVATVVDTNIAGYETASHEIVRANLEPGERLAGTGRTFWANTGQITGYDDLRGHLLIALGWKGAFAELDESVFRRSVYNPWFAREVNLRSPLLDAFAVGIWAEDIHEPIRGVAGEAPIPISSHVVTNEQTNTTLAVPRGGLRGVTLESVRNPSGTGELIVEIETKATVLRGTRSLSTITTGVFEVAIVGEAAVIGESIAADGAAAVRIWTTEPGTSLELASIMAAPVVAAIAPADDGLQLIESGDVRLYARPSARSSWFTDAAPADATAESVTLAPDVVTVHTIRDGTVDLTVDAPTSGTVIVSQYAFPGWEATVDGIATPIETADGLFAAVAVPAGTSRVVLRYTPKHLNALVALTAFSVLALVGLWFWRPRSQPDLDSSTTPPRRLTVKRPKLRQ